MDLEKLQKHLTLKNDLRRALLGEFMGTALLCIVVCAVVAQSVLSQGKVNTMININVGVGLAVGFGIAITFKISGGHINPAVSFMFLVLGKITVIRFCLYCLVQTAGAFFGCSVIALIYRDAINDFDGGIRQVFGPKATAGIYASFPAPHLGAFDGLVDQAVGMGLFCFLLCHIIDSRNSYPKYIQPILIGLMFIMIGTAYGFNCGYPLNPARDFGPRLFSLVAGYGLEVFSFRNYGWFWVPIVGPFIGGAAGGVIYHFTIGFNTPDDHEVELQKYKSAITEELQPLTSSGKMMTMISAE